MSKYFSFQQGGHNGSEIISVPLPNYHIEKFLYFIEKEHESKQTWKEIEGHSTVLAADHIKTINFDKNTNDRYFVVGCFNNDGYSSFKEIGKTYQSNPTGYHVNDVCS